MMGNIMISPFPYEFCLFSNPVMNFVSLHIFVSSTPSSVSISCISTTPALVLDLPSLPSWDLYM